MITRHEVAPAIYLVMLAALAVLAVALTARYGIAHPAALAHHGARPLTWYYG